MDLALFPALKMELGASCALEVEGRFYMFQAEGTVYCLGVYSDPSTVIGNNFLQGQSVVFDLEKRRWGVGAANISDWGGMESFTHCSANEAIQQQTHADITLPLLQRKEKGAKQPVATKKAIQSGKEASASKTDDMGKDAKTSVNPAISSAPVSQSANRTDVEPSHVPANDSETNIHKTQQIAKTIYKSAKPEREESVLPVEKTAVPSTSSLSSSVIQIRTAGKFKNLTAVVAEKRKEENYVVVNKGLLRLPRLAKVSDDTLKNCRVISWSLFIGFLVNVALILSVCFVFFLVVRYSFFRTCYIHNIKLFKWVIGWLQNLLMKAQTAKIRGQTVQVRLKRRLKNHLRWGAHLAVSTHGRIVVMW